MSPGRSTISAAPTEAGIHSGRLGVLLTNVGSPEAPTPPAVRRFLKEFLSDPRVIELPRLLWWPVLHGFVLPLRPQRAARAYQAIWGEQGSPLLYLTSRLTQGLEAYLAERLKGPVAVRLGMRYGHPSIAEALEELRGLGLTRLLLLPLYPQYCGATTGSSFDELARVLRRWRRVPELRVVGSYHDDPGYLQAVAGRIDEAWNSVGRPQRLLFSFHGIPLDYHHRGDPYFSQCQETATHLANLLGIAPEQWSMAFQSRVGPRPWLQPYTEETLRKWGRSGVAEIDVVCPGFAADCLETLEEVDLRYRKTFVEAGGRRFRYIPALNDTPGHVQALGGLVLRQIRGWPERGDA